IRVYQSYERALVKKQDDNDKIFSVLHSITIEMAYIDDEENEEHTFKVDQYAKNLKSIFSSTYSDECKKLLKELTKAFKELKSSIDAIFGAVYDWDADANKITTKDIEQLSDLRKTIDLDGDDDLPKKPKGSTKAIQEANSAVQKTGLFNFEVK
ncbi:MAG: hypothetical protein SOW11_06020, partial [Campylobacter lanienae]|nr:hypothetical protein [Campylobacter lanienae]